MAARKSGRFLLIILRAAELRPSPTYISLIDVNRFEPIKDQVPFFDTNFAKAENVDIAARSRIYHCLILLSCDVVVILKFPSRMY